MSHVLIVYASTHGHTEKIVRRISQTLRARHISCEVEEAGDAGPVPAGCDAVIVGGSIHVGHHQKELVRWAKENVELLNGTPAAFFSVCLTAADDTEESRDATAAYIEEFLSETGWPAKVRASFAGALQYREYDFATRLLMRLLMKHRDHPTDTSRDYDYTDWDAVDAFAERCAAIVDAPVAAAPA
jgi:menaquinone-dependent protoporphyrinogen oxidase